ncbi:hypothetical protein GF326_10725 [Candidatus Bathyarchaeota archaeon]|nr:hypothetical protein [Candidatus Bathyarchaeota archaeon]
MIDNYSFGKIVVEGKEYTNDLIIYPDHIQKNWWRKKGHRLGLSDLDEVLDYDPDILVIGQGTFARMKVSKEVYEALEERGIEITAEKTGKAIDTFKKLLKEDEIVVAALHLTC